MTLDRGALPALVLVISCGLAVLAAISSARATGEFRESDRPRGALPGDGGPSRAVFPEQTLPLRFSHERHVQRLGMPCTACHDAARTSRNSADRLLPPATRCDACHDADHSELSAVAGAGTSCGLCHAGHRPEHGNRVARVVVPNPNLKFDHAVHVERNVACGRCHGAVEKLGLATRDQLPRMRGCFECHGNAALEGTSHAASGECTTCHLSTGSRLRTEFASGAMLPPRWLKNSEHDAAWIERHQRVAADDSRFCASCHSEKFCSDCHDGRVRPRRVHPNDYLSLHPMAARANQPSCTSCHQVQSFCVGCHQRAGVTLSGPVANTARRGRFHPPKSVWTDGARSPGHHAWEAQRNLNACTSCHVERDCTTCHASRSVGGRGSGLSAGSGQGTNPHPAGFRARCGRALRKNARACLVCHAPNDASLESCR